MAKEKVAFVVNPWAGQHKRHVHIGTLSKVINIFRSKKDIDGNPKYEIVGSNIKIVGSNIKYYDIETQGPKGFCECVRQMSNDADLLVFLGGDGTHEFVMNNVAENIPIGGIPRGHGNAYASDFYLPKSPIEVAKRIINGKNHSIDTILYNNETKVLFAGIGMNALIAKRRAKLSRHSGLLAYAISSVKPMIKYDTTTVDITIDGKKLPPIEDVVTITITKLKYYGSDLLMVPQAKLADGYIHLNVFTAGRGGIIAAMLQSKMLRFLTGGNLLGQYLKGKEILIHTYKEQELHLNGTPKGSGTDFRFEIKPGSLIMRY